jgi:hypothetical protein
VIRLQPIQIPQTFTIIPSSYDLNVLNAATVTLVENGFATQELDGFDDIWSLVTNDWGTTEKYFVTSDYNFVFSLSQNGNYIEVEFQTPIGLEEGQIYTFTVKNDDDVFHKDLIYITDETSKKDVFTLPDIYTEYNAGKTEYIVL